MSKYILRLDDACEKRDAEKWNRMESLLDKYGVKPLVGVIPDCKDPAMDQYAYDGDFWNRVKSWEEKDWTVAMHGYQHLYTTTEGGSNPVNKRSEFAGEPLEIQKEKVAEGYCILENHGVFTKVFFAPSHTFDVNTLTALKELTPIRIISDTVANRPYCSCGMTFVPQQSGRVRKLPLHTVTFCYHPNVMKEVDFVELEEFLFCNNCNFIPFPLQESKRRRSCFDNILKSVYYLRR